MPVVIYRTNRTRIKEMKDAVTLEAFFSLAFLLFSLFLSVTCAFPFTYKRKSRMPHERGAHG